MKDYYHLLKEGEGSVMPGYQTVNALTDVTININWLNTNNAIFLLSYLSQVKNCNIDFSNGTAQDFSFNNTFNSCSFENFNISNGKMDNVLDLSSTFFGFTGSFDTLGVSNGNVCNVKTLYQTFASCTANIDVSQGNISNVRNLSETFSFSNLQNGNLSLGNTRNVQSLAGTFEYTSPDVNFNVSTGDTSNVIYMNSLFSYCSTMTNLNINNGNTINVIDLTGTFFYCNNLTMLNLSNGYTNKVVSLRNTFTSCSNLVTLDLSNCNLYNVSSLAYTFAYCTNLTNLYLNNCDFNVSNINNVLYTFSSIPYDCNIYVNNTEIKKLFLSSRNDLMNIKVCQNLDGIQINNFVIMNTKTKKLDILYGGTQVYDHPNNFTINISPETSSIYSTNTILDTTNACISIELSGTGEGNETMNIILEDDENNSLSQDIIITSLPYIDGEYTVESIDPSGLSYEPYDFILDSETEYYTSDNTGHGYSYALCRIKFKTNTGKLIIKCINQTTANTQNFGILSNVDKILVRNYYSSDTSGNVKQSYSGTASSTAVKTVTYTDLDDEEHFIEIKYRINNSSTSTTNKFQFKIAFL